ncbi:MAG: phosphoglycolate phosphatase [Lautropia sp.]
MLRAPVFPASRIEAACIDLDGTLLDTIPDLAAAANAMLVDLGHDALPESLIRTFVGKGAEVLVRRTLDAAGVSGEADFARGRTRFYANYRDVNGRHARAFDGVLDGLASLRRQRIALACVTNKPAEFVEPLLARASMLEYFDFCIGGDSLPTKKPDPGQLLEACRRFGLAPVSVAAVGDSVNDALAARAAGMTIVLVPYGYNEGRSVDTLPSDGIVGSLLEFARAIEAHHARIRPDS